MKRFLLLLILGLFTTIGGLSSFETFAQGNSCTLPRGAALQDSKSVSGWSIPEATFYKTCASSIGTLTCNNGDLEGGKYIYTNSNCTEKSRKKCSISGTTGSVNHLGYFDFYKIGTSLFNQSCLQAQARFQCLDGIFSSQNGYNKSDYLFSSCQEVTFRECKHPLENRLLPNNSIIRLYTASESSNPNSCESFQLDIVCNDSVWKDKTGNAIPKTLYSGCNELGCFTNGQYFFNGWNDTYYSTTTSENCDENGALLSCNRTVFSGDISRYRYDSCLAMTGKDCTFNRANGLATNVNHGSGATGYSASESPFPKTCDDIAVGLFCNDGNILGGNPANLFSSCKIGKAKDCIITRNDGSTTGLLHGFGATGYSSSSAIYPKTCEQISTKLSCYNGNIVGNWNMFNYKSCNPLGGLEDGIDLQISTKPAGGSESFAQYSSPALIVTIKNQGKVLLSKSNIAEGFLTCNWKIDGSNNIVIYKSPVLSGLVINTGTSINRTIILKDLFTQKLGDKEIICNIDVLNEISESNEDNNSRTGDFYIVDAKRFDIAMNRSIDSIKSNLDAPEIRQGAEGVKEFLMNKIMNILVPLIVTLGVLIAILGFYKIFFSSEEKAIDDGVKYITYGVVGIIVIMSAKFISSTLYNDIFQTGNLGYNSIEGYALAQNIYEKIAFPFIKLAIYLSLGVLFVILASRVLTFIFSTEDDTKKKAGTIIAWNAIGMFVIIGAKQVVEFIYGNQASVVKPVSNLGEIGTGILANKNLPILYEIINWAMGLASLVILIMILVQAFQLLLKPDDPDAMKKIKNSLLYIFIGIIVIGTGYIVTNFLIIN